jgi:hypothetical protein
MSTSTILVICGLVGFGLFITVIIHDIYVMEDKQQKLADQVLNHESCSDLNDSISFFNNLNAGEWIAPYDVSKFQKRMQELNCK